MKIALVLFVGCLAVVAVSATEVEKYTTKWDNLDLEQILNNIRLLKNYINCLLVEGHHCTPDALELKRVLPDAIKNDCELCSEKQKAGGHQVIRHLKKHNPDLWDQLKAKYDPKNEYEARHPELLQE